MTVTSLEPGPILPPYPATVVETVISRVTWEERITYSPGGPPEPTTSRTSVTVTAPETWIVSHPTQQMSQAFLPAGTNRDAIPCGAGTFTGGMPSTPPVSEQCEEARRLAPADETCTASGLRTACLGQCQLREDNEWWCYQMQEREYQDESRRMGRACWGGNLRFRQLNAPCLVGDVALGCVPCRGTDISWGPVYWEGPG